MKRIIYLLLVLVLLVGCHQPLKKQDSLKMVITSDIHYFLKDYYKECEWFEESMLYGDGKMVTYADEILDAFIKRVIEINPDIVLITGDLSFNGEKGSHEALAKRLMSLKQKDIAVAVIPGNHDVDNIYSKGYGKDDYFNVENIDASDFKKIYKNLGYDIASHQHDDSLSYRIDLNEDYTLLMMDTTCHQLTGKAVDSGGFLSDSTLSWMKKQLDNIRQNNKIPIVAMHHNLAIHNSMLNQGFTIKDNENISQIFKEHQVPFVLSGHMHCQNIKEINGIYDIASSSLLDAPLQFGVMTLDDHHMNYQTESLQISVDANAYFDDVSSHRFDESFLSIQDEKIREVMKDVVVKANRYFFTGNMYQHIEEIKKMPGYAYYQKEGEKVSFYKMYLEVMLQETQNHQKRELTY